MKNSFNEISFYRLTTLPILKAAPKLIEKIYHAGHRMLVITEDTAIAKALDNVLWSYSSKNFIPHGTDNDDHPNDQPVYITTNSKNLNEANIIMSLGKIEFIDLKAEKCLFMFDGNQQDHLDFARNKWQLYKHQAPTYWEQKIDGGWEKKNL